MPNNDPQTIWQNQNTEEIKVSIEYFKIKAEQLRSRNHWMVLANDLVCLATVAFLGYIFWETPIGSAPSQRASKRTWWSSKAIPRARSKTLKTWRSSLKMELVTIRRS